MNTKVFALICISLFAVQGLVVAHQVPSPQDQKGIVGDAVNELKKIVRVAIDDAKAQIQILIENTQPMADSIIASGSAQLQEEVDKILAEIEVLKQQAAAAGQNIDDCIEAQEEAIKQLPIKLIAELYHCVTDQLKEAIVIISDIVAHIEMTWDAVTGLEDKFNDCKFNLFCLGEVAAECAIKVVSLPIEIGKQLIKATEFIVTIRGDLEACSIAKVAQIASEAGEIFGNITECVANQLG